MAEAEKRAHELYEAETTHAAPVSAIVGHWGYSPASSGGRVALAALKKFGLLEDSGTGSERTGHLTELALDIILSPTPAAARRQAALLPRFHRQMWDEYGASLPSAATLRYRLLREFGFTESGAREFIDEYKATIEYAGLSDDVEPAPTSRTSREGDWPSPSTSGPNPTTAGTLRGQPERADSSTSGLTIPIPLLGATPVYISGDFPLSAQDWDQMMRVLEAMRPGLVTPDVSPNTNLPPSASPVPEAPGEADGGVRTPQYDSDDE